MKTLRSALLAAALLPTLASGADAPQAAAKSDAAQPSALGSEMERLSYALGVDAIHKLRGQGIAVDGEALARGARDASARKPLAMTDEEIRKALANQQAKMRLRSRFTGREAAKAAPAAAPSASTPGDAPAAAPR